MKNSQPSPASHFHESNQNFGQDNPSPPTMTSRSILEPVFRRDPKAPPEELGDDIEAKPLSMPEFTNDVQPFLVNQSLAARWIFTDRRRYAQAKAQGWRNCTRQDLKPGYAQLNPFEEEGGTKLINGDLILMLIDRKRYLGAKKYKHEMAARLANPGVARKVSAQKANAEMGPQVAAMNRQREMQGKAPLMEVYDPGNDAAMVDVPQSEIGRLGQHRGKPDTGKLGDLNKKED
jgi:hypothetical protein